MDKPRETPLSILLFSAALVAATLTARAVRAEPPILRLAMEREPATLDWHAAQTEEDRYLISFFMRGLLKYDGSGTPVCDLCSSYETKNNGTKYVFRLRADTRWSDGVELEASHFVDAFKRLLDPKNRFPASGDFSMILGPSGARSAIRATSAQTLEFELSNPSALFPHLLTSVAAFPIRREIRPGKAHATQAVLGPYFLGDWERGKKIVIEGNPEFSGIRPVYRVDFFVGSHPEQVEKYRHGRVDILPNPSTEDLLQLQPRNLVVSSYWSSRVLSFNLKSPQSKNPALRRAILRALDRESLPAVLKNGEKRTTGLIPPGIPGYRELPLVSADPAIAKTERARLGGTPITLTLIAEDRRPNHLVVQWLQDRLKVLDLRVDARLLAVAEFKKIMRSGAYDVALQTHTLSLATPVELLKTWTGIHPGYDSLFESFLKETRPDESQKNLDRMTQIAETEEVLAIPLGFPTQPFLLGPRVNRFGMTPFGDPDLVKIELKSGTPSTNSEMSR